MVTKNGTIITGRDDYYFANIERKHDERDKEIEKGRMLYQKRTRAVGYWLIFVSELT